MKMKSSPSCVASLPAAEAETFVTRSPGFQRAIAKGQLSRFEREMVKVTTAAEARVLRNRTSAR